MRPANRRSSRASKVKTTTSDVTRSDSKPGSNEDSSSESNRRASVRKRVKTKLFKSEGLKKSVSKTKSEEKTENNNSSPERDKNASVERETQTADCGDKSLVAGPGVIRVELSTYDIFSALKSGLQCNDDKFLRKLLECYQAQSHKRSSATSKETQTTQLTG